VNWILKQSFSRIKKVLTILLAFPFVVALTATTADASLFTEQSATVDTKSQSYSPEQQHSSINHDYGLPKLVIDKAQTALVVIDLQNGIVSQPTKPYPAQDVITNATKLVNTFRKNGMLIFLVHLITTKETMLNTTSDNSSSNPVAPPPEWSEFVPEIAPTPTDIIITKKQWGAFYGTDLELQLRRRGINTIVLCGISTDFGVESTARFAYEYGFQQIFAEDAMTSRSEEQHNAAVNFIFKRIGRVRNTNEILKALQ
jgi:nicotinamidase-related amidase